MPKYTNATYGGSTVVLENEKIRVEIHNRKTGWAYLEFYTPEGKLMGVMPYFGAVQDNAGGPRGNMSALRRFDAPEYTREETDNATTLTFQVHALTYYDLNKGSFTEYMTDKNEKPMLEGTVKLTLPKDEAVLQMDYDLLWTGNNGFVAMRGPWLLAGADSFGQNKTDAIFPGVEWLRKGEWSSNQNYMLPPLSDRTAPHPFKVAAPVMAVSNEGDGIGLAWDPLLPVAAKRPMSVEYYPQCVFSSPDAVHHADQHLMGLMLPTAASTGIENNVYPRAVSAFPRGSRITISAEVFLVKGNSLDVYTDWIRRHGLPEPPKPRRSLSDTLEFIARNYDGHLWVETPEAKGWTIRLERDMARSKFSMSYPVFMDRYVRKYADTALGQSLAKKLEQAKQSPTFQRSVRDPLRLANIDPQELAVYGDGILSLQQPDGSFLFDPQNPKSAGYYVPGIVHWPMAENIHKELCTIGDTSLETNVISALHLLLIGKATGDAKYEQAAYRCLDYCMDMQVPDGGDSWETPFHSPNLLATGHAGIAYELAYRRCGKPEYREKAIYWTRGFLVFTHLWEPRNVKDLYCTKPCFCATDWSTTSWVDTHVQWEVIQSLALASGFGIDWAEVDPDIDWHRYREGIVCAATHWILDSSRAQEIPYDIDLIKGNLDGLLADAHDPITGENFGWQLMPDYLADLILDILEDSEG